MACILNLFVYPSYVSAGIPSQKSGHPITRKETRDGQFGPVVTKESYGRDRGCQRARRRGAARSHCEFGNWRTPPQEVEALASIITQDEVDYRFSCSDLVSWLIVLYFVSHFP
jgi:hypothetical protein